MMRIRRLLTTIAINLLFVLTVVGSLSTHCGTFEASIVVSTSTPSMRISESGWFFSRRSLTT